jgi:mannose/fructose/N-acetylgalactosamine-specific phosphotransferase system component IIB
MARLAIAKQTTIRAVNLGGIHHRADRQEKLRYLYLTTDEIRALQELERHGVEVTARDVPASRPIPLSALLEGTGEVGAA